MASQKIVNCFVAANYLVTTAYPSTPHSSKFARLAFYDFCLAITKISFFTNLSRRVSDPQLSDLINILKFRFFLQYFSFDSAVERVRREM